MYILQGDLPDNMKGMRKIIQNLLTTKQYNQHRMHIHCDATGHERCPILRTRAARVPALYIVTDTRKPRRCQYKLHYSLPSDTVAAFPNVYERENDMTPLQKHIYDSIFSERVRESVTQKDRQKDSQRQKQAMIQRETQRQGEMTA